jgi:processive 1,2-diacylglycerol beta-glucosyltransferase
MSLRRFVYLLLQPWDLIISTHFLSGEIVATLRREKRITTPHVMVTTDFETHRLWVNQPCEHYFTATEEAALYLQTFGVPRGDATATGIPIHPVFSRLKDRAACRARQGLAGDRPVILQLSGGCGVGPIEELYRTLLDVEVPSQVVVVTAYNTRARQALEAIPVPGRHRARILGFTHEIDELMTAADLVVTKPGGLTTSELLAVGAAMVIVDPVPGQEDRNSDFLLENGAAIKVNHFPTMAHKLTCLLRDRGRLEQMRASARRLGRPRAAFEVAERSLALLPRARKAEEARRKKEERKGERSPSYQKPAEPGRVAVAGVGRFVRCWRASRTWFELFELQMMHLFARLWHRCSSNGPPPVPSAGPALVVANHPSNSDPAFLLSACARPLRFLHAREYFDVFMLRRLFRLVGCIPVGRRGRDVGAVRQALQCLRGGEAVCVFPEGDLSREHGVGAEAAPAKTGAAFLALKSWAPVYPAYLDGGPRSRCLVRDWLWPSRGVRVVFGPPIDLSAYHGRPITHELLREVTAVIMRRIGELAPGRKAESAERGAPSAEPPARRAPRTVLRVLVSNETRPVTR